MEIFFFLRWFFLNTWLWFADGYAYICNYIAENRQNSSFFLQLVVEIQKFFAGHILNYKIFFGWLCKFKIVLLKINKIHTFFRADFLKCVKLLEIHCVFMQLICWKPEKKFQVFCDLLSKFACFFANFLKWANFCKFLLQMCSYFTEKCQISHFFFATDCLKVKFFAWFFF